MKKSETVAIMAILKEAYPMYYKDKTKDELNTAINLWTEMFADDDVNLVKAAVKAYIANDVKGFPPVIGQIKASLHKITQPEQLTEQEAWNLISRAIKNSAYHATEEYQKLPPIIQKVITPEQLKEWSQMEVGAVQSVVASNFMRSYKAKVASNKEYQALPNNIKQLLSGMADKLSIEGGKQ